MSASPAERSTLTFQRRTEFNEVLESTRTWAKAQSDIQALALVGSWAREEASMDSDIDLVLLTHDVEFFVATTGWIRLATAHNGLIVRSKAWGPLHERRVKLASGLLVEYGFAPMSWASVDPVDRGTASVVANGFQILYDPVRTLQRLASAVEQRQA